MLPPEVEDIIIDYNFNDPKTLARCALVCRGWLDTTRFHLWRTVSLGNYGEHDPDEFLARINEQPDIALHVREVKVMFPLSSPRPHFLDTLLRLFAVLPQAERLLLDRIYSDPLIPSETSTFPSHNPVVSKNLKFLKISRCRFDNTEPLERLFRAFPNIQDFSVLRSFTIGSSFLTSRSHGENEFRGSLLPHLSKLRVISLNQSFLMTWMSRFVHLSDVTTLEIGMHEGHVESWLSSIILAMSHKLESIRFVNSTYTPSEL